MPAPSSVYAAWWLVVAFLAALLLYAFFDTEKKVIAFDLVSQAAQTHAFLERRFAPIVKRIDGGDEAATVLVLSIPQGLIVDA